MRITIMKPNPGYEEDLRKCDYDFRSNYSLEATLTTDGGEDVTTIDDEVQMFAEACQIAGYAPETILKGMKRYIDWGQLNED